MPNSITAPVTVVTNTVLAPVTAAADAYQLALRDGFVGNRAAWLASLVGADGASAGLDTDPTFTANSDLVAPSQKAVKTALQGETATRAAAISAINDALALTAPLANASLTGIPTAPTALPAVSNTQLATTAFVHALVTNLIGAAPGALDTLGELAAQLTADGSALGALTTTVTGKLAKASNLSDLTDAATARDNLGLTIGTHVQAQSTALNTWSGITPGGGVGVALGLAANTAGGVLTHGSAIVGSTGILSAAGVTSTPALKLSGAWLTVAGSGAAGVAHGLISDGGSWSGSSSGTGLGIRAPAGFTGNLIDAQNSAGASLFSLASNGVASFSSTVGSTRFNAATFGDVNGAAFTSSYGVIRYTGGGTNRLYFGSSDDTAIGRASAGALEINNTNAGIYRDLLLRNLTASGTVTATRGTSGLGTVSVSGTAVTGVGTDFLSRFAVGDSITVTTSSGSETKVISTISSDTALVTAAFSGTAAAGTAYTHTSVSGTVKANGAIAGTTGTFSSNIVCNDITLGIGRFVNLRSGVAVFSPNTALLGTNAQAFLLGGSDARGVRSSVKFIKSTASIADNTATAVLTVTIPNAAHSAVLNVRLVGSLGAGGAVGANEASACICYNICINRTAGVNAVAVISTAYGSSSSSVAGATTATISAVVSAISGAAGPSNTFTVNVTIAKAGGSSANHTCITLAELVNANATGIYLTIP